MEGSKVFRIMREEIEASCDALRNQFNKTTSLKEKQEFLNQMQVVNDLRGRILERFLSELGTNTPELLNSYNEEKEEPSRLV